MASAFAHAFVAVSLGSAITPGQVFPRLLVVGTVCSLLPDADVLGLRLGIAYGDLLGHRGLSHSLAFAVVVGLVATPIFFGGERWRALRLRMAIYLLVISASHGVLDAMTNGGLGVAFFSPFDATRYFLPVRPVEVSAIGAAFLTYRSVRVLFTELVWIGLPWSALTLALHALLRSADRRRGEAP